MATGYLSKTFGSAGNQKTFTTSVWLKRTVGTIANGDFSNTTYILSYDGGGSPIKRGAIWMYDTGGLVWGCNPSGSVWEPESNVQLNGTTVLFRDPSAWYHIVFAVDTTQATASDRLKCWINGVQYSMSAYPAQNLDTGYNNSYTYNINRYAPNGVNVSDVALSHFHQIDGTAYDASYFGEFDATTGIWKPKTQPSVTYGTNGFFLKFENSGSMGLDSSGNGNDFTVNGNLTQTVDTPSNVFVTLNPSIKSNASITFNYGNTSVTGANGVAWLGAMGTIGATKGKWYAEAKITDPLNFSIGFAKFGGTFQKDIGTPNNGYLGIGNDSWGFWGNGASANLFHTNTGTSYGSVTSTNDIIMLAMDLDNGNLYWGKNGTWFNSSNPATSTSPAFSGINIDEYITFGTGVEGGSVQWNFGNGYFGTTAVSSATSDESGLGIFEHTVPNGYNCLCTKNINTYG